MRSLGLDVGDKRIGVAVSDPEGTIAFSLTTIAVGDEETAMKEIIRLAQQYNVGRIVIGLPRSLDGTLGRQANKVMAFAERLRDAIANRSLELSSSCHSEGEERPKNLARGKLREEVAKQSHLAGVDIKMWDERLSTKAAERLMMEASGKKNKPTRSPKRRAKTSRSAARVSVDAMAAAFILQGFLDSCRPGQ